MMMNNFWTLVGFELKKMLTPKKTILTVFSVVTLLVLMFLLETNSGIKYDVIQQEQITYTGAIDSQVFTGASQEIDKIRKNPDNFNNGTLKEEFSHYGYVEFCLNLNETRGNLSAQMLENTDHLTESQQKITNNYSERLKDVNTLVSGDTISISLLEDFVATYNPLFLAFLISFFISPVFSQEKSNKTDKILYSSRFGNQVLVCSKFFTCFIVITCLYALVIGTYYGLAVLHYGSFDPNASLIMTQPDSTLYLVSPFDFTMGEFFPILILLSYSSTLIFGLFTMYLSAKLQKSLTTSMLSMVSVLLPYIIFRSFGIKFQGLFTLLKLNFADLMSVRGLYDTFYGFSLGNTVVCVTELLVPVLLGVFTLLVFLTLKTASKSGDSRLTS